MGVSIKLGAAAGVLLLFCTPVLYAFGDGDRMMGHDSAWAAQNIRSFGFISGGIAGVDLKGINNDLRALRLSTFKEQAMTWSLGMQKEYRRLITENSITGLFWEDQVDSTRRTSIWMGNIVSNTGFNILPTDLSVSLFPLVGIGVGLNTINVRSNEKSFSDLLASSEPASMLWQAAFLINLGGGTDFRIVNEEKGKGILIGIRAGYLFDPFSKTRWYSDGTIITNLSSINANGAYARLVLGGWHASKR